MIHDGITGVTGEEFNEGVITGENSWTFLERYKRLSPGIDLVGASLTNYKLGVFISFAIAASNSTQSAFGWLASFLYVRKRAEKDC